jgi:hypothetical protein
MAAGGRTSGPWTTEGESESVYSLMGGKVWIIFFNSMRKCKTPKTRVPLEVLQEKHGVDLQLHFFLGTEFLELKVFDNAELERSCKNGSGAVPNIPLT